MKGTSSTSVTIARAPIMAAQSTLFCDVSRNTLPRTERMLKLWKISHMFMVRKAMVMPSGETPFGISK